MSTQLEFNQAMTDFKVMFPDMDAEVIEAVLRANNGAVDMTIDHLLAMSADNEVEKVTRTDEPPAYAGDRNHPPSYTQATNDQTEDLINLGATSNPEPTTHQSSNPDDFLADFACLSTPSSSTTTGEKAVKHAYSHPIRQEADEQHYQNSQTLLPTQQQLHEIYEENLRLREEGGGATSGGKSSDDAAARNQYLEDERIALMLQNEEFMAELQGDSEFMSSLEMEQERSAFYQHQAEQQRSVPKNKMDSEEFRDKLKNMGKTSKRKFSQMAAIFSRRKSAAKQFLGQATAPSKDNLLLNAEPLVNEDEDSDSESERNKSEHHHQQSGGGGSSSGGGGGGKTPSKGKYTSFS